MQASRIRRVCQHVVAWSCAAATVLCIWGGDDAGATPAPAASVPAQAEHDYAAAYRVARAAFAGAAATR